MGLGAVVVGMAAIALLVWAGLLLNSRRAGPVPGEEPPPNLQPYLTDDELENKRLTRVLAAALMSAALLAVALPIYYLGEANRQAKAAEKMGEAAVEEGKLLFEEFQCAFCHGADGSGGGARFVEARSQLTTSWLAPSLNDVLYRYTEDEARYWIEYGRKGTPMPPAGLDGGGSMTSQQIDDVLAYIRSFQITQEEAVTLADTRVKLALDRIDRAPDSLQEAAAKQQLVVDQIIAEPAVYEKVKSIPTRLEAVLIGPGTCTPASARAVEKPCTDPGPDSDRDGLADGAEPEISRLFSIFATMAADYITADQQKSFTMDLDPTNAYSVPVTSGEPQNDLEVVATMYRDLSTDMVTLSLTAENNDKFAERAKTGADFIATAITSAKYAIEFTALADEAFSGDLEKARRAVGLYNSYCARCHTAGYSAGVVFEQEPGSGAWGPSLRDGKAVRQFPDPAAHYDFIVKGSERAVNYGENGLGNGYMPAFGFILSQADIELIVAFERWL